MTPRLHTARLYTPELLPVPVTVHSGDRVPWIELGHPGLDPAQPCLDIFVFDHSGSVASPGGTDPIGRRFIEAAQAIRLVRAWTFTTRPKVAVLHFDQPSTGDSGVVTLKNRHAMTRLLASLREPVGAAGTSDLDPSLTVMEHLAAEYADHIVRATILSDFQFTDTNPDDVYARLTNFPGQAHAVVLNATPPPELARDNITITPITHDDPIGAVAEAFHRSLTANRRGRRASVRHANRGAADASSPLPGQPSWKGHR